MKNVFGLSLLSLAFMLTFSSASLAQDPRVAAILMVEDRGNGPSERLGVAVYRPFLEQGPYAEVATLVGPQAANERLAATIRELAGRYDAIDVFLSIHTTRRDPAELARLIPPAARKLRLVYSTACYGNDEERLAWEQVGARTVVTHVGLNNPVIALPLFLSQWIAGAPVAETCARGFQESSLVVRLGLSLPGGEALMRSVDPEWDWDQGEPSILRGSRPVISGDPQLRIHSGLPRYVPARPQALEYRRETGSSLGLALRAASGRYEVSGAEVVSTIERLGLSTQTLIPGVDARLLRHARIEDAKLRLWLHRSVKVPVQDGFKLKFNEELTLRAGALDPVARTLKVHLDGVWVQRGLLRFKLSSFELLPAKSGGEGYRLRVGGGLWGFVPFKKSLAIGGRRPEAIPAGGPVVLNPALDPAGTPGMLGPLATSRVSR